MELIQPVQNSRKEYSYMKEINSTLHVDLKRIKGPYKKIENEKRKKLIEMVKDIFKIPF
jgi:hypothetical protein